MKKDCSAISGIRKKYSNKKQITFIILEKCNTSYEFMKNLSLLLVNPFIRIYNLNILKQITFCIYNSIFNCVYIKKIYNFIIN